MNFLRFINIVINTKKKQTLLIGIVKTMHFATEAVHDFS